MGFYLQNNKKMVERTLRKALGEEMNPFSISFGWRVVKGMWEKLRFRNFCISLGLEEMKLSFMSFYPIFRGFRGDSNDQATFHLKEHPRWGISPKMVNSSLFPLVSIILEACCKSKTLKYFCNGLKLGFSPK